MKSKEFSIKLKKIRIGRSDSEKIYKGTLSELIEMFYYTLDLGNSVRKSINKNPKTINSFISNLRKSFEIKEAKCYDRTIIELIKE